MRILNKKGFTLIELVLVITLLGILLVGALPQFINMSTQASQSSRDGVVGAVRSAIGLARSNDLVLHGPPGDFPPVLDSATAGAASPSNLLFTGTVAVPVLQSGITDDSWTKVDDTHYTFSDGTSIYTYTYDPATGSFRSPTAP